jgi:hypothetical protein
MMSTYLRAEIRIVQRRCLPHDSIYLPRSRWCCPAYVGTLISASVLPGLLEYINIVQRMACTPMKNWQRDANNRKGSVRAL